MELHIESVKIWRKDNEVRVYVKVWRGETSHGKTPILHEGIRYVTGNHWQAKGTMEGDLTREEWQAVFNVACIDKQWQNYTAPISAYKLVTQPKPQPQTERPTVATTVENHAVTVGDLGIVTINGTPRVLICTDCGYVRGMEEEDPTGWHTNWSEPTATEQMSAEYQQLTQHIATEAAQAEAQAKLLRAQSRADQAGATNVPNGDTLLDTGLLSALWGDDDD
jgi:hypothetical protein